MNNLSDKKMHLSLVTLSLLATASLGQPEDFEDATTTGGALNLELHHSLDGGATFFPRGSISVDTSRSGNVALNSDDQMEVDPETVAKLGDLCASSGLYLLQG